MGSEARKRGLPAELPVMAALTESGLKNLDHGDADSVGFFQMRLSVWNQGAYAGFPADPKRQLDWFLDQAEAVKSRRLAAGEPIDAGHYGDWVADVERPAAQYRGRYEQHLAAARALLRQAPDKQPAGAQLVDAAPGGAVTAGSHALKALSEAKSQLGVPYRWGGSSPSTGFDCSGLVQWAYAKAGIRIPRTSEEQILASNGTPVSRKDLLPGDLVFFRDSTGDVHHVGISLGGDKFVNAPHTGDVVRVASLKEPYFAQQFTGGRRFEHAQVAADQARAASVDPQAASGTQAAEAKAVRLALNALQHDAAQAGQPGTLLHRALERQERGKGNEVQVLKAVEALRNSRRGGG
jgi:cell wall-associated NlpC family hydrolase